MLVTTSKNTTNIIQKYIFAVDIPFHAMYWDILMIKLISFLIITYNNQ